MVRIEQAEISPNFRELFEERGLDTVRSYVGMPGWTMRKRDGTVVPERDLPMLMWLKEQYDRADRKETWSLTMEAAITVFILAELAMSILVFIHGSSK